MEKKFAQIVSVIGLFRNDSCGGAPHYLVALTDGSQFALPGGMARRPRVNDVVEWHEEGGCEFGVCLNGESTESRPVALDLANKLLSTDMPFGAWLLTREFADNAGMLVLKQKILSCVARMEIDLDAVALSRVPEPVLEHLHDAIGLSSRLFDKTVVAAWEEYVSELEASWVSAA